jgi:hypothetical protein
MRLHLLPLLAALAAIPSQSLAEPEPDADAKKSLVKPPPPFPDSPPDVPILPPPPIKKTDSKDDAPPFKKPPADDTPPLIKEPLPEVVPMPRHNDTGKPFDIINVAPFEGIQQVGGRVGVGFFNHSDRDLVLEIDGRPLQLNSRYYVQVKLPREFRWREKDGPTQTTKVPSDAGGVEIIFRK